MICSTNHSLGNFSEYALKSSQNILFAHPNLICILFVYNDYTYQTFLNANIQRLHPNFLAHSQVRRNSQ